MSAIPAQSAPVMSDNDMIALINSAKPGDRLKIIFVDSTFNGDLQGRLYMLFSLGVGDQKKVDFGDLPLLTLQAVADNGCWDGCFEYTITIMPGFDAEYFASRSVGRRLLRNIEKLS